MIGPRLELRTAQQLVMTPQLQQAIKLLQMSNLELSRFVDEEIERNPLLDRGSDSSGPEDGGGQSREDRAARSAAEGDAEARSHAEQGGPPTPDRPERLTVDAALRDGAESVSGAYETGSDDLYDTDAAARVGSAASADDPASAWGAGGGASTGGAAAAWSADLPGLEETLGAETSLIEHLAGQIGLIRAPRAVRNAAMALAADIDEAGYLRIEEDEAARRLGVSEAELTEAIGLLHQCEPVGIGARSLSECLSLQLADRDRLDPAMAALLDHLPLLARADFRGLARICGVDEEDVRDMAAEIRRLDPRPGREFTAPPALAAVPDVFVRRRPDGTWTVELNTDTLPRVLVDNAYAAELAAGGDAAAKHFVSECRQSGGWLVRSLEQRARTILKVAVEIVRRQEAFFEEGVSALRPMTLRMVADEIGMHESTVSRVAAGKHLACERGIFDLRWFFTQALAATDGGEAHSATAIRDRIRDLILAEDPRKTLSDDRLMAILRNDGVDIARRTVAKYREGMNIPSSVQRRRLKSAAAS
ncbi:RNA polymerase, sigma 54 subunit, RpoN/SigL [Albimonas donghaensis]|uniref:RNA polymerase sigma-54 factor n=1 Tax=Albimonas donghaensis TaxID=356660 RepID=A0A1H3E4Y4_9RHOB|nr:RNA polymerase factor sigma-54 [Albimonas donghaensis]SDX72969.1 RNA polymerase, sigma 54 subunit, RpoN/SigL [Albimonas donghaensis]